MDLGGFSSPYGTGNTQNDYRLPEGSSEGAPAGVDPRRGGISQDGMEVFQNQDLEAALARMAQMDGEIPSEQAAGFLAKAGKFALITISLPVMLLEAIASQIKIMRGVSKISSSNSAQPRNLSLQHRNAQTSEMVGWQPFLKGLQKLASPAILMVQWIGKTLTPVFKEVRAIAQEALFGAKNRGRDMAEESHQEGRRFAAVVTSLFSMITFPFKHALPEIWNKLSQLKVELQKQFSKGAEAPQTSTSSFINYLGPVWVAAQLAIKFPSYSKLHIRKALQWFKGKGKQFQAFISKVAKAYHALVMPALARLRKAIWQILAEWLQALLARLKVVAYVLVQLFQFMGKGVKHGVYSFMNWLMRKIA